MFFQINHAWIQRLIAQIVVSKVWKVIHLQDMTISGYAQGGIINVGCNSAQKCINDDDMIYE